MVLFGNKIIKLENKGRIFGALDISKPNEQYREKILEQGELALKYEPRLVPASYYMEFFKSGSRATYESPTHERRDMLARLTYAAIYGDKERYIPKMIDIIWAICEETSWVIPPHSISKGYVLGAKPLPDQFGDDILEVDLFSATTGATLSLAYFFFEKELSAATQGVITERIRYEIRRRIIKPFLMNEMRWEYSFVNNWLPWIISNVLTCASVIVDETLPTMQTIVSRSAFYLDRFVGTYGDDCGCNEGASYWNAAGAALFDACELLYDITGGAVDGLHTDFMKKTCRFIADMCICPDTRLFVNFADCGPYVRSISGNMLRRMGKTLGDGVLETLGEKFARDLDTELNFHSVAFFGYRYAKSLFYSDFGKGEPIPEGSVVYPDLEIALLRAGSAVAVLKGGHNRENHNHNDVGTFLLYFKNEPVIIDSGNLEYTRDTFNENRYKIWTNQSSYHNLPDIDGVMQEAGAKFRSDRFECRGNTAEVSYGGAYPINAKITRKIELDEKSLTVSDCAEGGEATYHFMCRVKPQISGNTAIIGRVKASFSENGGIVVDKVDVSSSPGMKKSWDTDALYRINVKANTLKTVFTEV